MKIEENNYKRKVEIFLVKKTWNCYICDGK